MISKFKTKKDKKKLNANPKSAYRGVSWHKNGKKHWQATRSYKAKQADGTYKYLDNKTPKAHSDKSVKAYGGIHETQIQAARASDAIFRKLVHQGLVEWKYKMLNFPNGEDEKRQHDMQPGERNQTGERVYRRASKYKYVFFDQARNKWVAELKDYKIHSNNVNEEQCYADFVRKCLEAGIDPTKGKRNSDVKREESVPLVKLEYALPLLNPIGVAPKMHQKFGMKKQKRRNKKRKNAFEEKSAKKRNRLNDGFATTTDLTWFPPAKDERIAVNEPNYIYYHCQTNVHKGRSVSSERLSQTDDMIRLSQTSDIPDHLQNEEKLYFDNNCNLYIPVEYIDIPQTPPRMKQEPQTLSQKSTCSVAPSPPLSQDSVMPQLLSQRSSAEELEYSFPNLNEGFLSQTSVGAGDSPPQPSPWNLTGKPFELPQAKREPSTNPFEDYWNDDEDKIDWIPGDGLSDQVGSLSLMA